MKPVFPPRSFQRYLFAFVLLPATLAFAQTTLPPIPSQDDKPANEIVELSPFTVSTEKDRGYAATNVISGSRINTAIKDIPLPIQVITSEFIRDTGATNLRKSLAYSSSITLQSQNDLENKGGIGGIQNSAYGPGGVNNPEGVTSNISGTQLKIRGFITNNVLRDGFLRGSPSDAVNIDRVEVVQGPNALLYGTGNFGGVVNYLTKRPQFRQQGYASLGVGTENYLRTTLDLTGPLLADQDLAYRVIGSWQTAGTTVDYQKNSHYFISPSLLWRPSRTTEVFVSTEMTNSYQNGFGFRALRAAQGTGATPINNDQLEATGFYWPPGADRRTFNLSGPDTFNDQKQSNVQIVATQQLLTETETLPRMDLLVGFNRSSWEAETRNVNGGIEQIAPPNPGSQFGQTITIAAVGNGLGDGITPSNGNLQYGTFDNEVVKYAWNDNNLSNTRKQLRVELTARKALFTDRWFQLEDQVLAGYSDLYNKNDADNSQTLPGLFSYKGPLDLDPIRFGVMGDGSPAPGLYQNSRDTISRGWNSAFYVNNFIKFGKIGNVADRLIFMAGVRRDTADAFSTNTNITAPGQGSVAATTSSRADTSKVTSRQTGLMLRLTQSLSVFALKADGFQPNFGGLTEALSGTPVGADTAESEEIGLKFDFLDGKISGSISKYKITKNAWIGSGFSSPAPLGNPRFDPTKPIIYNLGDANGTGFQPFPGFVSNGQTYTPNAAQQAAWAAAVAAGAVTLTSPITGTRFDNGSIYLNASTPTGAAWMDAFFAAAAPGWAGWPYKGNDVNDPGINNATLDDAAFQNAARQAAIPAISEASGWDVSVQYTPNDQLQFVLTGSFNSKVQLIDKGKWIKYPYPEDRWATWYFPNGGFGLKGQTLTEAYADPTDTSTRNNTGAFPGDDTPDKRFTLFTNYKFKDNLEGWIVGLGADWAAKRAYFSGITRGSGQLQTDTEGNLIVLFMPDQLKLNGFVRRAWTKGGYNQSLQLNVDNLLNDTKLYGLIYNPPISAKITYEIAF
jgi:iron complex outermembrane recepter protein